MRRFIADSPNVFEDRIIIENPSEVNHIKNVLRMSIGDTVIITDSVQYEYTVRIIDVDIEKIEFEIISKEETETESENEITLFQCVPKQGKMEVIIQKTVELGVFAITPVYSERSVSKQNDSAERKNIRWNKIAAEAVKQCKRTLVPKVNLAINFKELPSTLEEYDFVIMPYENEKGISLKDVLKEIEQRGKGHKIAVIIGPEGGFSDKEVGLLNSSGTITCSLGKTILRTETASIATISMIMYELEL